MDIPNFQDSIFFQNILSWLSDPDKSRYSNIYIETDL